MYVRVSGHVIKLFNFINVNQFDSGYLNRPLKFHTSGFIGSVCLKFHAMQATWSGYHNRTFNQAIFQFKSKIGQNLSITIYTISRLVDQLIAQERNINQ